MQENLEEDLSKTVPALEIGDDWRFTQRPDMSWAPGLWLTSKVQELVPILSIGLNEVVRQAVVVLVDITEMRTV